MKKGMRVSMPMVLLVVFVGSLFLYSFREGVTMRKNKPGTVPAESVASSSLAGAAHENPNLQLRGPM